LTCSYKEEDIDWERIVSDTTLLGHWAERGGVKVPNIYSGKKELEVPLEGKYTVFVGNAIIASGKLLNGKVSTFKIDENEKATYYFSFFGFNPNGKTGKFVVMIEGKAAAQMRGRDLPFSVRVPSLL
jgi:hypothetical protein